MPITVGMESVNGRYAVRERLGLQPNSTVGRLYRTMTSPYFLPAAASSITFATSLG
jgi:hypothetical protein